MVQGDLRMTKIIKGVVAAGMVVGIVGGHSDKPHKNGRERPPVDQLDERDAGLQSRDVIVASDKMANDILAGIPELNASTHRWTVVVMNVEIMTSDTRQNYDIFLERVRVRLSQLGR